MLVITCHLVTVNKSAVRPAHELVPEFLTTLVLRGRNSVQIMHCVWYVVLIRNRHRDPQRNTVSRFLKSVFGCEHPRCCVIHTFSFYLILFIYLLGPSFCRLCQSAAPGNLPISTHWHCFWCIYSTHIKRLLIRI